MMIQLHSSIGRIALALIIVSLGVILFATGVWAGSSREGDRVFRLTPQGRGSFWGYDAQTGNPTGPQGQPDFWNYDPATGDKVSDWSPGVAPDELAELWSVAG